MRMFLVLGAVLVLATGCSPREAEAYSEVNGIVADLTGADIECTESESLPDAQLVDEGATCASSGTRLSLRLFDDAEDRDNWKAFGNITGESLVIGPNWIVSTPDSERAEEISEALGGELEQPQ